MIDSGSAKEKWLAQGHTHTASEQHGHPGTGSSFDLRSPPYPWGYGVSRATFHHKAWPRYRGAVSREYLIFIPHASPKKVIKDLYSYLNSLTSTALSNRNTVQVMCNLKFLSSNILKSTKEWVKLILIAYLLNPIYQFQHELDMKILKYFTLFFYILGLLNPVCSLLTFRAHSSLTFRAHLNSLFFSTRK